MCILKKKAILEVAFWRCVFFKKKKKTQLRVGKIFDKCCYESVKIQFSSYLKKAFNELQFKKALLP